jgi:hypothetical protein
MMKQALLSHPDKNRKARCVEVMSLQLRRVRVVQVPRLPGWQRYMARRDMRILGPEMKKGRGMPG